MTAWLTVALGAAALGGAGVVLAGTAQGATLPAAQAPNTPPEGSHRLSTYYIWPGQSTTLIVTSLTDDSTPASGITQVIDWGDGSTQTVPGTTTQVPHAYQAVGTYTPRVTLSDGTAESVAGRQTPGYVTVDTPVVGFKLKQTSVWAGKPVALAYHTSDDADTVRIFWGDGKSSTAKASVAETTVNHTYAAAGAFTVTAAPANEYGTATPRKVGTVTATKDATKPTVTLTKPGNPSAAASWATVRGTSSDVGLGVQSVALTVIEQRGTSWYYYTGSTWTKASSSSVAASKAKVLTAVPAGSGAWSTKIKGLGKGTARFTYSAADKAGNRSTAKRLDQKLTR